MSGEYLEYFVLGLIAFQILKLLALGINQAVVEHRQKRVLKLVQIIFPENEKVTFVTSDSSDKRAMAKIERELRLYYDSEEDEDDDLPQFDFDTKR